MTNTKQLYTLFSFGSALTFFVFSQVFSQTSVFSSLQFGSAIFFSMVLGVSCFLLHCFFQSSLQNFYKRSIFVYITLFLLPFAQLLTLPLQDSVSIILCILFLGFNYKLFFGESFGLLPCLVFGFPILVLNPLFLPILLVMSYLTFPLQKEKSYLIFSAYMVPFLFQWIHLAELDVNSGFFSDKIATWIKLNEILTFPNITFAAPLLLFSLYIYQSHFDKEKSPITPFIISFFFFATLLNHESLLFVLFTCLYILSHILNPKVFDQVKTTAGQYNPLICLATFLYFFYLRAILPLLH